MPEKDAPAARNTQARREIAVIEHKCSACGKIFFAYRGNKRKCCSVSCGQRQRASTHRESRTRLHNIWCGMRTRCRPSKNPLRSSYYSGRSISVCEEWDDFVSFRNWSISNGYRDGLEIDRIDNTRGYSPRNCRWASRVERMRNTSKRRNAKTSKYKGVSWCANVGKWRVQLHQNGRTIHVGLFNDETMAAEAYDRAATELYGEFACLNFKEEGASF